MWYREEAVLSRLLKATSSNPRPLFLSVLVALIVVRFSKWLLQRKRFIKRGKQLPGPPVSGEEWDWKGHIGSLLKTRGRIPNLPGVPLTIHWFQDLIERYPDEGMLRLWSFNPYLVLFARLSVTIFDPDLITQLLTEKRNSSQLIKEKRIYKTASPIIGSSFLALPDGPEWRHQRKLTAPAFHQKFLEYVNETAARLMRDEAFPVLDKAPLCVDALEWSTGLTTELLGQVAFSHTFRALERTQIDSEDSLFETLRYMLRTMAKRLVWPPVFYSLPTRENREFNKASRRLNSVISRIVEERLAEAAQDEKNRPGRKDLLSYMMLKDKDGSRLSYDELFGNVRMFLFAGHDTRATVVAYALWELAAHTEIQERLRKEIDELFEGLKPDEIPTFGQLRELKYLDAVTKEVLRLHSPAPVVRTTIAWKHFYNSGRSCHLFYPPFYADNEAVLAT